VTEELLIDFIEENRFKGRGESFGWTGDDLKVYLHWAARFNYLFVSIEDNKFTGVAIMYPMSNIYDGDDDKLFDFGNRNETETDDLCIMDFISTTEKSKKDLVSKLKSRYPNWKAQNKWALRFGEVKKISNRYINLLNN
jgi:hypothetical protein